MFANLRFSAPPIFLTPTPAPFETALAKRELSCNDAPRILIYENCLEHSAIMHAYTDVIASDRGMTETIRIESIRVEHAQAYHRIVKELVQSEKYLGFDGPPPPEVISEIVDTHVRNDYPLFLAFDGNDPIGWCVIYQNTHKNFCHLGQMVIGVSSVHRGLGIGRALLSAALSKAWSNGLKRVELEVCKKNHPAIHLYRSFGFKKEGIKKRSYFVDGAYEDIVLMSVCQHGVSSSTSNTHSSIPSIS